MEWIYVSPHPDDVALSCGGLLWEQAKAGERVSIWTICMGDPPRGPLSPFAQTLHARWGTSQQAIALRKGEDITSCEHLGASHRHFDIPDCIYRRIEPSATDPDSTNFLYPNEESIFGPIHPADRPLIHALSRDLKSLFPPKCEVVSPLTIGNHVDHGIVRAALEDTGHRLWYYSDYPYVLEHIHDLEMWEMSGLERKLFQISSQGLTAWQASIAAHQSQISTFWSSQSAMETAIKTYSRQLDGIVLWKSL